MNHRSFVRPFPIRELAAHVRTYGRPQYDEGVMVLAVEARPVALHLPGPERPSVEGQAVFRAATI